jgi:hypothetical protein
MASSWSRCHARDDQVRDGSSNHSGQCSEREPAWRSSENPKAETHTTSLPAPRTTLTAALLSPPSSAIKQWPPNPWPANHAWALPNGRWQQVDEATLNWKPWLLVNGDRSSSSPSPPAQTIKKKQTKNNATTRPLPRPQLIKIAQAAKAHSKQWTLIIYNFLSWTNSYYFGFEKLAPEEH